MAWDPTQYDRFRAQRARPARDLIAALPPLSPGRVADLGCGGGALARSLAERWPDATVLGVDGSAEMLAQAAGSPSRVEWRQADLARWQPDQAFDLIVSNAALHWLPDHASLFGRLVDWLAPGGVLAVQMPRNFDAASHRAVRELAEELPWRQQLAAVIGPVPVHEPERYYDWLAPRTRMVEIWETTYLQVLTGHDAVLNWLKGTTLVPVAEALGPEEFSRFESALGRRLASQYPERDDGTTLFPFRRLFMIAAL